MGLQIWLPLNGSLENQGLSNYTVINNGATIDNNGKIGKCYSFNGSNNYLKITNFNIGNEWSYGCWVYSPTSSRSWEGLIILNNNGGDTDMQLGFYTYPTGTRIQSTANGQYNSGISFTYNQWNHLFATFDGTNLKTYINGLLVNTKAITNSLLPRTNLIIGARCRGTSSYDCYFNGKINDVRIYDHCLSQKEVEEIAKGLVLHYKLTDNETSVTNLLYNGFGESGTENWETPANVKTDIKPSNSNIYASFIANTTKEYIPIYRNTSYFISFYIKQSTTSGTTYPSILPYDIDKKFIANFNSRIGFNLATMTTLTQPLNPGDTKIYVNSLSQWNANSGHYYNHAAIFGYKDSTGYVYPDGTYTADAPNFGSSTNAKTNLDKTNNIITLISAYTGQPRPVGTSVCAATDGSTYFYPVGGVANSSITNWTFKQATFSSEDSRLLAARYIRFYTYANGYIAGITIKNTAKENKIYDVSGYQNNGSIVGELTNSTSTPRYDHAAYINSSDPTTNSATGEYYISAPCSLVTPSAISIAWWACPENGYGGTINHAMWSTTANDIGSDYQTSAFNHRDTRFDVNSSDGQHLALSTSVFIKNEWHHYVVTYDGQTAKLYKDGVQQTSVAFSAAATLGTFTKILIGHSRAGGVHRKMKGKYSDFRVYTTALTIDQIKELYNTSATIDNLGNVYTRELVEI